MATQLPNATDSQTHETEGAREVSAPWVRLADENYTEENVTSPNKSPTVDGHKRKESTARKYFEKLVIGVVIATVWVSLALPIVLYHLPQVNLQQCHCKKQ